MARATVKKQNGRIVKCFATGEYGTSLNFVKHDNHWWKNEEVYNQYAANCAYRTKAYDLYSQIIGYEKGKIFPPYVHKRFQKLEFYGWECIYQNMLECRSSMEWAIYHKDFQNENHQTAYLFVIMEGNINSCYSRMKKEKEAAERLAKKRDEEVKYSSDVDMNAVKTSNSKKRDISKWLDDDE